MFRSLQTKIVGTTGLVVVFSILTSVYLSSRLLKNSYNESVRQQLQTAATSLLSLGISDFAELNDFDRMNAFIEHSLELERVDKIVRIFDQTNQLMFTTVGAAQDPFPQSLSPGITQPIFFPLHTEHRAFESLVIPYEAGRKKYYLQIIIPLARYTEILQSYWWQCLGLIVLLFSISILLSRWLTYRLLRPVQRIADYLKSLDDQKVLEWPHLSLQTKEGMYLEPITQGIHGLVDRVQSLVKRLQKMGRFVAHELRNPLTILQGEAETILMKEEATPGELRKVLQSSLEETERMSDIIDTVLKIEEQKGTRQQPLEKIENMNEWLRRHQPMWEKTLGSKVELDISPQLNIPLSLRGSKLLFRLIDNLVRNVKDHAHNDSFCRLSLLRNNGRVCIAVSDEGVGMSAPLLQDLNAHGNSELASGAGLYLCHKIADLCDFELQFLHREPKGLTVEVWIG